MEQVVKSEAVLVKSKKKITTVRTVDELMSEVNKGQELIKQVQKNLDKNRLAVRRWLSFMG